MITIPAAAHDVTITGTNAFASLDGSSSDHDGAANGVFTVNDGNLVVNGVVNCNDDTGASDSACAMAFSVSGNMSIGTGGALYAENRSGSGIGGAITLNVGGSLSLSGNAIVSTASKSSSGSTGGAITANTGGAITVGSGTTIDSGSANARGGAIVLASGALVTVNGNVLSGPSRTFLSTRLSGGAALDGGTSNTIGGSIAISSSTFVEPAVTIGATANVVSQGADGGAGPVTIDGCGVTVRGLVAALSRKDGVAKVSIRSGKDVVIDGRDLGGSGTRMGRIRADAPTGTALNKGIDIFAAETIDLYGPASGYLLTSLPGLHDSKSFGGLIRITSLGDAVNGSGNLIDDGHTASGDSGGTVEINAKEDVNLNTAVIRAVGDFSTNNPNRGGGAIRVRSYSGDVIWTNGIGEVRPIGSSSNLPLADQGSIVLTACGTVNTAGSSFPVMGSATSVFPEAQTGVCAPAAPSLPTGVPPLVTCNTPPVANDTAASTHEDTTVTITLSGSDADGDPLTFTVVSGPANGSLGPIVPTGPTTATVNYTPSLNYNGTDSFVFRAHDGNGGTDDATAVITIAPVNDAPSFLAGPTVTALEDSGAQSYANWATSISGGPSDESGQTVTFTVTNSNPSLFSVQPAVASNGTLTFTPAANAFGTANITVTAHDNGGTANGGVDTSAPQTSSITVNGVNDEPSFSAGASQTVNEDAGPQSVSGWASGISAGPNEGGQTVSFSVTNDNNALFSAQPAVASNGTLTYTPAANASGVATVTIYAQDDGGTANGGDDTSAPQTFTITVSAVNDAPSFTSGGNVTVLEDSGAYSAAWATGISAGPADENGQTATFSVSNDNNALFAAQPAVDASGNLTFTTAANAFGSATVTVTLSDNGGTANGGADTSAPQSFTITITAVNDEPSFTVGGNVTVGEDSGAYSAAWATAISAGAGESGQALTFSVSNDNNALFSAQPAISASGVLTFTPAADANGTATVTVYLQDDGGTADGGDDTSSTVTFTINVTAVNDAPSFTGGGDVSVNEDSGAYSAMWASNISAGPSNEGGQTLTFNVTNNNNALFAVQPSIDANGVLTFTVASNASGSALVTVTLSDGSDTSAPQTFTILVNGVNDAPSFTAGGDVTVNEDSGASSAAWAGAISAGPSEAGQTVAFVTSNNNNALFSTQPSISAAGVLTFTPAPNAFGTATVSVYAQDNGGTANGGVDTSATVTFTITVNGVNDPPAAGNDAWETEGNTELRVDHGTNVTPHVFDTTPSGTGVLHNDVDSVEGDPFAITGVVGCADTTAPFVCAVTGGTVTLEANGSFTFQPTPGATSGSFQYTVTDQPAAGTPASANGTVTLTIHDMIWYVNGNAAAGGNGTSTAPFKSFSALDGSGDVDGAGAYIFVHTSTVNGSIALEPMQKLWGEGVGLIIPRNLNGNGAPATLVAPGIRPNVVTVGDAVTVTNASGVEVAGLNISSASGNGIEVSSPVFGGASSAAIYSNVISAGAEGIYVSSFNVGVTGVAVNGTNITSAGNGIDISGGDGTVVFSYSNGAIVSTGGSGITGDGSMLDALIVRDLTNVTVDGNTAADGINLRDARFDANAGTPAFETASASVAVGTAANPVGGAAVTLANASGDAAFASLTAHGTTAGLTVTGSGLFAGTTGMRITSGGGAVSAAAGTGLTLTNATIGAANLSFTSVSATGAAVGINVDNTGTSGRLIVSGTGAAGSGGSIPNATQDAVRLVSTSASLSDMNLTNSGQSHVDATNVDGLTLTRINADNSVDHGILGANVRNLVIQGGLYDRGGAGSGVANKHGVFVTNLLGASSVSGATFRRSNTIQFRVLNTTATNAAPGTPDILTVTGATFDTHTSPFAGDHLSVGSSAGGNLRLITNSSTGINSFTGAGNGIQATADTGGTLDLSATGVRSNGNLSGFNIAGANGGKLTFKVFGNTTGSGTGVVNSATIGMNVVSVSGATVSGTIDGNSVAGAAFTGIQMILEGNGSLAAAVTNNSVTGAFNTYGIRSQARLGNGLLSAHITGNTVNGTNNLALAGISLESGASGSGHANTICLNLASNTSTTPAGIDGYRLRQRVGTTFNLQNFAGNGASTSDVANWVNVTKGNTGSVNVTIGSSFSAAPSNCPAP